MLTLPRRKDRIVNLEEPAHPRIHMIHQHCIRSNSDYLGYDVPSFLLVHEILFQYPARLCRDDWKVRKGRQTVRSFNSPNSICCSSGLIIIIIIPQCACVCVCAYVPLPTHHAIQLRTSYRGSCWRLLRQRTITSEGTLRQTEPTRNRSSAVCPPPSSFSCPPWSFLAMAELLGDPFAPRGYCGVNMSCRTVLPSVCA